MNDEAKALAPGPVRTAFLDRDGVINEKMPEGQYVTAVNEFRLLAGVAGAILQLNRAGIRVIVVSNQRGVAMNLYSAADVEQIHDHMRKLLAAHGAHVDAIYFCPHDKGLCNCRKPLPGLFEQAKADFPDIAAEQSLMVGDSLSDIEFGIRLGMRTIFIEGDPHTRKAKADEAAQLAGISAASLEEAVRGILDGAEVRSV